tara:strand:+ start:2723 stop:2971 length:249 start_codon:yes stop_codon:yes gene_type:complete
MNNLVAEQLIRATLAKFESSRQEALAIIELYLNHPVGVAEHPSVIEEISKATIQLADAEEAIEALRRHFLVTEDPKNDNTQE